MNAEPRLRPGNRRLSNDALPKAAIRLTTRTNMQDDETPDDPGAGAEGDAGANCEGQAS